MTRISKSSGVALVISLLMLVAITLLAISAIRNTTMQERMAANLGDREVAKLVAEATLAYASTQIQSASGKGWYTEALPVPADGKLDQWNDPAFWSKAAPYKVKVNNVDYTGQFIVENLGLWTSRQDPSCKPKENPLCERQTVRITARSQPKDGRANVMLQVVWRQ